MARYALVNPIELYDPRREQARAIQQSVYEASVKKLMDQPSKAPFRTKSGMRMDAWVAEQGGRDIVRDAVKENMFQKGLGHLRNAGWMRPPEPGESNLQPTAKCIKASRERYTGAHEGGFNHLISKRQDYEETLALSRRDDSWFRVVEERGPRGAVFCVWPLAAGDRVPVCFKTLKEANQELSRRLRFKDPTMTGRWWAPPAYPVVESELKAWLPPTAAFRA